MKGISIAREFTGNDNDKSVRDLMCKQPIQEKEKVLSYLNSFTADCVAGMTLMDEITGKDTGMDVCGYKDSNFYWDTREIYHFEKYNLQLDNDFLKYILQ